MMIGDEIGTSDSTLRRRSRRIEQHRLDEDAGAHDHDHQRARRLPAPRCSLFTDDPTAAYSDE